MGIFDFRKKNREVEEFERLLESHLDGLYRVAMRYTRNNAQAEDLVQDTVVRALRFRESFELGTNFKAWVYTILTHTFIHKYRRSKRERELLEGVTRHDVAAQLGSEQSRTRAAEPEAAYLEQMLSDDVLAALDELPEDFRTVVTLCDLEGLAYKDIADAVGCPVGTVMSRLYRGRRMLESKLAHVARERGILRDEPTAAAERSESANSVVELQQFRRRRTS